MNLMLSSTSTFKNICTRCGKERIVVKEWEEITESGAKMKKRETACPDPSCQEEVSKALLSKQKDRERKEMARLARIAKMNDRFNE
jgi:hypothetical protein